MIPTFAVPAEYFYALTANLPPTVTPDERYRMATLLKEQQIVQELNKALDAGTIHRTPYPKVGVKEIQPQQAARRLRALVPINATDPTCPVATVAALVQAWLDSIATDIAVFWQAADKAQHLELVLCAVTQNHGPLIAAIKAEISSTDVEQVAALTTSQWQDFFRDANQQPRIALLPPFTAPGTAEERIDAFIRYLRKFFKVVAVVDPPPPAGADDEPGWGLPQADPIAQFLASYGAFVFGAGAFDPVQLENALQATFPNDEAAREWLRAALTAINELYGVLGAIAPLPAPDLRFSILEALYARGFTSQSSITALGADDFAEALVGTVAFPWAQKIHAAAGGGVSGASPGGEFEPVNPDDLVNCVPPAHLSPLGPVEYLHELLRVGSDSRCKHPQSDSADGSLEHALSERRGPVGDLHATRANLETPLPRIDLVNECLEVLAAGAPHASSSTAHGVVYDTVSDQLSGHRLRRNGAPPDPSRVPFEHDPATLFEALPEHSSPATPVKKPVAYEKLRGDFSAPALPYAQPLDLVRSYLDQLDTDRYSVMRRFREKITEFVLSPAADPPGFRSQLWRYPVRIEIAREYLGVAPEEYDGLFAADVVDTATLYGFGPQVPQDWTDLVLALPEFLERTALDYCDFIALWKSSFVRFSAAYRPGGDHTEGGHPRGERGERDEAEGFPTCEPCYPERYRIVFDDPHDQQAPEKALRRIAIFIRLWRKLQAVQGGAYSFGVLRDICEVLRLFLASGDINPDFIRQLAAFQILRDDLQLQLFDPAHRNAAATGSARTHLLALWDHGVDPTQFPFAWAVDHLLDRLGDFARAAHGCGCRSAEFLKLLADNLDPLSLLAGFNPGEPTQTWRAHPTHTLRFAEILAKIYASDFSVGEIIYLFTADAHLHGDDPLALQSESEALADPFDLPDDEERFSLWALRRKLLDERVTEEEEEAWSWTRIEAALQAEFGVAEAPLQALARRCFPDQLAAEGSPVDARDRQYRVDLAGSSAPMWNTPPDGPFHYDLNAKPVPQLWTQVPLTDAAVVAKLARVQPLDSSERKAVRELYFAPRLDLVPFAFLFPNFIEADLHIIQETDAAKRWAYFRHHFVLTRARCRRIAEHLAEHVAVVGKCRSGAIDAELAHRLLKTLWADENRAVHPATWEQDSGAPPKVLWGPQPVGGAFAAILGLAGTGLLGEFVDEGQADPCWQPTWSNPMWREVRGPTDAFGADRNTWNAPVPPLMPAMDTTLTAEQLRFAGIRNGFALANRDGARLGGAQGFSVVWRGVLLVEREGTYGFFAGAPTPDGERPDFEASRRRRWRVTLARGQRRWVVLSHHWFGEEAPPACAEGLCLRRGAYDLTIELVQPQPELDSAGEVCLQSTGFQLKYAGPDSDDRPIAIPLARLYVDRKDGTLAVRRDDREVTANAQQLLEQLFVSTVRDIRRTYQRAFKALLFAHRFGLSAHPAADDGMSEIDYLLDPAEHAADFAGMSFYRDGGAWKPHRAHFDLNLLPLLDNYKPPAHAADDRVAPSVKRRQALFDIWERIFDHVKLRREAATAPEHPVWLVFHEAAESHVDDPAHLLRHMGVDLAHSRSRGAALTGLVLRYFEGHEVDSEDLEDEQWAVRVWKAELWLRELEADFFNVDIVEARPDLWASDDPGAVAAGETESGNANLTRFLRAGLIENGDPRRYEDLKRLNDGLRERARRALLAFLCGMDRVPLPWGGFARAPRDLGELLLLDVEAGLCQKASRIEDAITAAQLFVERARLGLEPGANVGAAFLLLWDRRFATFRIWEACRQRELYRENWIEWDELERARRTEAFRFLEDQLRRAALTVPMPGSIVHWDGPRPPARPGIQVLQAREPAHIEWLPRAPEGLGLLGTPERHARPSWLAPLRRLQEGSRDNIAAARGRLLAEGERAPFWIEAAIRLGARFLRVAAAGLPPASVPFEATYDLDAGCCVECGRPHAPVIDEYYFWLIDSRYYKAVTQEADWEWRDETRLPELLDWKSEPMVHLMWCRVHNGEFQQPRWSDEGVRIGPGVRLADLQLEYLGRHGDSLTFSVPLGTVPTGLPQGNPPGFRYDMLPDTAVVLPLVVGATPAAGAYPGGLPAYPYFAWFAAGASLMPPSLFSPALAVAGALRAHCRFEAALRWYEAFHAPLDDDNRWCKRGVLRQPVPPEPTDSDGPIVALPRDIDAPDPREVHAAAPSRATPARGERSGGGSRRRRRPPTAPITITHRERTRPTRDRDDDNEDQPRASAVEHAACCDSVVLPEEARRRAVLLHHLETLLQWGEALLRKNTPESFQQARLVFDTAARVLGDRPRLILDEDPPGTPQTVADFVAHRAPLNPRLGSLYERTADRLALIHACLNARRLRGGRPNIDMPYFGDSALRDGWQTTAQVCLDDGDWCSPRAPYRFVYLVQKAQELANEVRGLGAALLAAFEKGDAEYLAALRAGQERQLLDLALSIRQDQWREADWQVQALQKAKEIAQTRRRYNQTLLNNGLNSGELLYQSGINAAIGLRTSSIPIEVVGQVMGLIPDIYVGTGAMTRLPIGTKLAEVFHTIARILNTSADISNMTASLRLTEAGWARREEEWLHQVEVLDLEIEQVERQILGARRRRDIALRELNNHRRQMENAAAVHDFLRDKFTSHALYLWLQKETAALYYLMYEMALHTARQAQYAFNYERGHTARVFVPTDAWDNLHEGLLAGERLQLALRRMEKAYLDENLREYEVTKHVSLRLHFPLEFLQLKVTGACEIEIPEWMFDLDYPGHYMRRIRNVTLTLPCVVGPYTGVHCRLTLLSSTTRVDPRLSGPPGPCCDDEPDAADPCGCDDDHRTAPRPRPVRNGYVARADDPRVVKQYAALEAIATSSGQNDTGLFELSFRDERYLPFEFAGAVSRWRIELPPENNHFDFDSLSDAVLQLNYTAREGGDVLRRAADEVAQQHLRGDGWRLFDVRHEMTQQWQQLQASLAGGRQPPALSLRLSRGSFPFIPGHRDVVIRRMHLLFEAPGAEPSAHHAVEFLAGHHAGHRDRCGCSAQRFECVASADWPGLYHGVIDVELGPLAGDGGQDLGLFRFAFEATKIARAFLLCVYE